MLAMQCQNLVQIQHHPKYLTLRATPARTAAEAALAVLRRAARGSRSRARARTPGPTPAAKGRGATPRRERAP